MAISRKLVNDTTERKVERFTVNATQDANQELFLSEIPKDPSNVVMDIPSGTVQFFGFDYDVDGNRVFWGGLALETVLELNDKIIITYN